LIDGVAFIAYETTMDIGSLELGTLGNFVIVHDRSVAVSSQMIEPW